MFADAKSRRHSLAAACLPPRRFSRHASACLFEGDATPRFSFFHRAAICDAAVMPLTRLRPGAPTSQVFARTIIFPPFSSLS
jgi:hypothetical protein